MLEVLQAVFMLEALLDGILQLFVVIYARELLFFAYFASESKGSDKFVFEVRSEVAWLC